MLTIESRMVNNSRACNPISLKHMMCWFPFLDSHLTTHLKCRCSTKKSNRIWPAYPREFWLTIHCIWPKKQPLTMSLFWVIGSYLYKLNQHDEDDRAPSLHSSVFVFWRFHLSHAYFIHHLSRTETFSM